ncbi:molybdenum ABC transporter ATP-binding protein [Actibacterium pelagium]|uniref:Molybdenum import ATP-binding protein ModC n=1 Tax=Actibacterium pelagium TaxID=2029103 RepID=A0A917AKR0_9RHOB|nr:molybdenum ABC transporter ATP-binding protein [Actibacterium pelagium]GGE58561.1 molybdenum import ATP-binding protein ModC [Actibacterium pelagium]
MTLSVHLTHRRDDFSLDVSFEAPPGVTVLFGQSGSGKTTVINAVAGLLRPDNGRISVGDWLLCDTSQGMCLPPHKRRLGYVFQEARLFPHMTVQQNLRYGQRFAPRNARPEDEARVTEMLGIGHLLSRRPSDLSGGEKQRVAIGRALLASPKMILADEPLASLDADRKEDILPYFERLRDETDIPILYVSHSAAEVARLATTVVALHEGRVTRIGSAAEVLSSPDHLPGGVRAAGAVLDATVRQHHDDGLTELNAGGEPLFLPRIPQPVGQNVRVRIAAHEVLLSRGRPEGISALNILEGEITALHSGGGPGMMVTLSTPAGLVPARITKRSAQAMGLNVGDRCTAVIKTVAIAPIDIGT